LANTWAKTLKQQNEAVWMAKESSPILKIRKHGVLVKQQTGVEEFIPLSQFHVKTVFALKVDILQR
jgi:hypothetical protein